MSKEANGEPKGFASSVFLVAAVTVVVVAGMFLKTDAPRNLQPAAVLNPPASALPFGSTVTPDLPSSEPVEAQNDAPPPKLLTTGPADPVDPVVQRLAARVGDDCARLAKARGRWTAQLLVACKPDTVDRLLGNAGASGGLYVLPVQVKDDACFRVCFGTYATSKEAALASDLPKALRGKERIGAVEIAKVLP